MRLTQALQFYIRYRRVPGLLRYGKNRVVTPISISAKRKAAELMVFERENIDILNKPFLSVAEEAAYNSTVTKTPYRNDQEKAMDEFLEKLESLPRHITTDEVLGHLNVDKKWE
ncbi:uncharacterized protein LOC101863037 [Aplysia californica]|uniref:Uncharacterized protein LOC101863037 n=1 Tax=Aplysia californica TaxID=6500 RepID=A0ABM0JVA2_APLCA|nr:uncharacterized protein LOC101863037 [Aplysia californica]